MNYSEKLKDIRWLRFRDGFISSRRQYDYADQCDDCGEDTFGSLHVHHRRYVNGREPWEYEFSDLRLLCADCHHLIHDTEDRARGIIRSAEAHVSNEFDDLLAELEDALKIDNHTLKIALAHAKNAARSVVCSIRNPQPPRVQTMADLEVEYRKEIAAGGTA